MRLTKEQITIILTVTFGNILEWFEIYSYAYLAPILSRVFFNFDSEILNLSSSFTIFGIGFISRPFGAILFGRIGDLLGRKLAFVLSITLMTIPTFAMGCLRSYEHWGIYSPLLLILLRLLQSIPSAGEVPGTICYLYENAELHNKKFMTSWTGVGNQIGAILGIIETLIMDQFGSHEFLVSWGWRISFWTGGLVGLFGIYLRHRLHETPQFKKIKEHHKLDKETISEVINNHKKTIGLGIAFGVINATTFYLLATYIPTYFVSALGLNAIQSALISLIIITLTTILLPAIGYIGEKHKLKPIMIVCSITIICLLYPLSIAIHEKNLIKIFALGIVYIFPITCISAFLAYLLANLFPTQIRFTGLGLAWNITDGIFGGFTPAISLFLLQYTGNQAAFCWFIFGSALISLISYFLIRE